MVLGSGSAACSVSRGACVRCFVRGDGSTWKSVLPKDATKGWLTVTWIQMSVISVACRGPAVSVTNRVFSSSGRLCSLAKPNYAMVLAW